MISEQQVQNTALVFLKKRYKKSAGWRRTFAATELRTRKKYGSKRADGLIAFRHLLWGTYVVSIEAKSAKTLGAIRPRSDLNTLLWNCFKVGIIACLLSGAFLTLYKQDGPYYQYALPMNILFGVALTYGFFTKNSVRHQIIKVVKQIKQYPANRQWLACSADSLDRLSDKKQKELLSICKTQGIGLLYVDKKNRVTVLVKPKFRWKWLGDFLSYYSREREIRGQI